jgi:hypothetical protein
MYSKLNEDFAKNINNPDFKIKFALNFDFEILHNKYIVFRMDKHIYYYNLLNYDSRN